MDVVSESEHVDDKEEDDVLCDLLSRHLNDVDSHIFRDADEDVELVTVRQVDNAKVQNSWDKVTNTTSTLENFGVEKLYACNYITLHYIRVI